MLLDKRISIWYFVNAIKWQIVLICIFAVVVGYVDQQPLLISIDLPLGIPAIVGTAVSLLLTFRTSQSYERWWEARVVWGAIVNDSRTFIRQLSQFIPDESRQCINAFAERQIIWNYALGESLRRLPFSKRVEDYLQHQQIEAVNVPNALLDKHADGIKQLVSEGLISEFRQVQLNETLARLCDSMGKCERIKNTVFPKSYSLLVHTLIYVFTLILPFSLDDSQIKLEVATTILLPVMFIAIEKTAILMQDPFENTPVDTPMTSLAQTIEINILQMIGADRIPVKQPNESFYEM